MLSLSDEESVESSEEEFVEDVLEYAEIVAKFLSIPSEDRSKWLENAERFLGDCFYYEGWLHEVRIIVTKTRAANHLLSRINRSLSDFLDLNHLEDIRDDFVTYHPEDSIELMVSYMCNLEQGPCVPLMSKLFSRWIKKFGKDDVMGTALLLRSLPDKFVEELICSVMPASAMVNSPHFCESTLGVQHEPAPLTAQGHSAAGSPQPLPDTSTPSSSGTNSKELGTSLNERPQTPQARISLPVDVAGNQTGGLMNWWSELHSKINSTAPYDPVHAGHPLRTFSQEDSVRITREQGLYFSSGSNNTRPIPSSAESMPRMNPAYRQNISCLDVMKNDTLKVICREHHLRVTGNKLVLLGRIGDFLMLSTSLDQFEAALDNLNSWFYREHCYLEHIQPFRTRAPLDVSQLIPQSTTYPPLPPLNSVSIRRELTPPILLFKLRNQIDECFWEHDNFVKLYISVPNSNNSLHINVYRAKDTSLPDDQLLAAENLEVPGLFPLRMTVCRVGQPSPRKEYISVFPGSNIEKFPTGSDFELYLWNIRASHNMVVQIVSVVAIHCERPHKPVPEAPLTPLLLPTLSIEQVKSSFFSPIQQQSEDIILDSISVSLKCPVSLARIQTPIRPSSCLHLQCFDFDSLAVLSSSKIQTFNCPICNRSSYRSLLIIDGYFTSILSVAGQFEDPQVKINPNNGEFSVVDGTPQSIDLGDGDEIIHKTPKLYNANLDSVEYYKPRATPSGSSWSNPIVLD